MIFIFLHFSFVNIANNAKYIKISNIKKFYFRLPRTLALYRIKSVQSSFKIDISPYYTKDKSDTVMHG